MEPKSQPKLGEEKMGLSRALLAGGFMILLVSVGIGAATGGNPWSKIVAVAGLVVIGIALIMTLVEKLTGKRFGKTEHSAS